MPPEDENTPAAASTQPPTPPTPSPDEIFTKADVEALLEKARQQEKDKVYGRLESLQSKLTDWEKREQERQTAESEALKKAEEEARRKEEENLSAKELLTRKEQEWQERLNTTQQSFEERLAAMQQEREQERALLEKEKEFAALQAYTQQRLAQEAENIAPELVDFINGRTRDEVEQSIAVAKAKSAEIAQKVQGALQAARAQQRGASISGFAPVGPMETEAGQRQYSPEDIKAMDMNEYAKFRQSFGIGGAAQNRGMFG